MQLLDTRTDIKSWKSYGDKESKFFDSSVYYSKFIKSNIENCYITGSVLTKCNIKFSNVFRCKLHNVQAGERSFLKDVTLEKINLPAGTFVYHNSLNLSAEYRYPVSGLKGYHILYLTELKKLAIQMKIKNNTFYFTEYPEGIVSKEVLIQLKLMEVLTNTP